MLVDETFFAFITHADLDDDWLTERTATADVATTIISRSAFVRPPAFSIRASFYWS